MTTATAPAPTELDPDTGEPKYAHYVIGGTEAIMKAMLEGTPCTALCGKVWVPSRDPKKFPVCPRCRDEKDRGGFNAPEGE